MKNIVTLSHFAVLPPTNGGTIRMYNLYLHLEDKYKFHHYCVSLRSPFIKKSSFHGFIVNYMFFPFCTIVAFPFWLMHIPYGFIFRYTFLLGKLPKELDNVLSNSDLIIIEEPHLFKWIHKRYPYKLFILNTHNVQYDLEIQNFKSYNPLLKKIVKNAIKNMESYAVRNANKITAVSELDKKTLIDLYKINKNIVTVVPNGCNLIQKLNKNEREKLRKFLMEESGFNFDKLIFFI